MDKDKVFSTDNFQLASFLLCKGFSLKSADTSDQKRVKFLFIETDELIQSNIEFSQFKGLVEPHQFFSAQKDLKNIIYSGK